MGEERLLQKETDVNTKWSARINFSVLLVAAVTIGGCEQGPSPMSLEDARKVAASIPEVPFVAPPRRVDDILQLLAKKNLDTAKVAELRAKVESSPPATKDPGILSEFFFKRAVAALEFGREVQRHQDLMLALEHAKIAGITLPGEKFERYNSIIYQLGGSHLTRGEYEKGRAMFQEFVDRLDLVGWNNGQRFWAAATLARFTRYAGNIKGSREELESAIQRLRQASPRIWENSGSNLVQIINLHTVFQLDVEGKIADAEPFLREAIIASDGYARNSMTKFYMKFNRVWAANMLADNLRRQHRFAEAERVARENLVFVLREYGPWHLQAGHVLRTLGRVRFDQGYMAEAITLHEQALRLYQGAGLGPEADGILWAKSFMADALASEKRWHEAATIYDQITDAIAVKGIRAHETSRASIKTLPLALGGSLGETEEEHLSNGRALALIQIGRVSEGLEIARAAVDYRRKAQGDDSYGILEARGIHAIGLAATGRREAARAEFADIVPRLLRYRGRSHSSDRWIRLIVDGYLDELEREVRTGKGNDTALAERSFAAASALGAQGSQSAVGQAALRGAAGDAALAELIRSSQDIEQSLDATERLLLSAMDISAGEQSPSALAALQTRAVDLRRAQTALEAEITLRFPRYAELKNPPPPSLAEARRVLTADQSLVVYYLTENRTYVWAIPARGEPAFAAVPVKRSEVESLVGRVRKSVTLTGITLGDVPAFDAVAAHRLYELLLKPVESGWKNARSLVVVPDGPLGYLPFPLLATGPAPGKIVDRDGLFSGYRAVPWLARTHAVSAVPSVSALVALRRPSSPPAFRQAFAGLGDPWFNAAQAAEGTPGPIQVASRGVLLRNTRQSASGDLDMRSITSARLGNLSRLPETREEVMSMARALKADEKQDVFLGREASEERAKSPGLSNRRVITFATHGLVAGDLDGLAQPALALSAPEVTGGKEDGLLTMTEILGLKLNADWVVLSACNTAAAEGKGAEAVSGLGRAFFYAGAKALLATHWAVETTSATALTTELFRRQAVNDNLPRAEALRQAMLALIDGPGMVDGGKTVASYAHPLFWAPFALVGDGGGTKRTRP